MYEVRSSSWLPWFITVILLGGLLYFTVTDPFSNLTGRLIRQIAVYKQVWVEEPEVLDARPGFVEFKCTRTCNKESQHKALTNRSLVLPSLEPNVAWTGQSRDANLVVYSSMLSAERTEELYQDALAEADRFWLEQPLIVPQLSRSNEKFNTAIPEIYHITWFNCRKFDVSHFMALCSALKFVNDKRHARIVMHTDCEPNSDHDYKTYSTFWNAFKVIAARHLVIQPVTKFNRVWDKSLGQVEHVSDVFRLFVLLKFGGIYLDDDLLLLKSHAQYHNSSKLVISEASSVSLANGFMMSPPGSSIVARWLQEYKHYTPHVFGAYSVQKIWKLWREFPDEVEVIKNTMVRPNWLELDWMFSEAIDWRDSYNIHLSRRFIKDQLAKQGLELRRLSDIECLDNTFGEITRFVMFGEHRLCEVH